MRRSTVIVLPLALLVASCSVQAPRPPGPPAVGPRPTFATGVVYANDFEKGAGPEWSDRSIGVTPKGKRRFLGPFADKGVTLSLNSLPRHKCVRVTLDLYIMQSWAGDQRVEPNSTKVVGPDLWSARVDGGPTLLRATFSNVDLFEPYRYTQSFPDDAGVGAYPPRNGASETDSMGYTHFFGEGELSHKPCDAVYKLTFVFPHSARDLRLVFDSAEAEPGAFKVWGLDNVRVSAMAEMPGNDLGPRQMEDLWETLTGDDPLKASDALWELAGCGDKAARMARDKMHFSDCDRALVSRLIAQLDDDVWRNREEASRELERMGAAVLPFLHRAMDTTKSAEAKSRLQAIIEKIDSRARTNRLVRQRACKLLEVLDHRPAQ